MKALAEEVAQETTEQDVEVYLRAGIKACKDAATEAGVDSEGLKAETKKCCINWLKAEEFKQEHDFVDKAGGIFAEKFDGLYGERKVERSESL